MDDTPNATPYDPAKLDTDSMVRPALYLPADEDCVPVPLWWLIAAGAVVAFCAMSATFGPVAIRAIIHSFS